MYFVAHSKPKWYVILPIYPFYSIMYPFIPVYLSISGSYASTNK